MHMPVVVPSFAPNGIEFNIRHWYWCLGPMVELSLSGTQLMAVRLQAEAAVLAAIGSSGVGSMHGCTLVDVAASSTSSSCYNVQYKSEFIYTAA